MHGDFFQKIIIGEPLLSSPSQSIDFSLLLWKGVIIVGHTPSGKLLMEAATAAAVLSPLTAAADILQLTSHTHKTLWGHVNLRMCSGHVICLSHPLAPSCWG